MPFDPRTAKPAGAGGGKFNPATATQQGGGNSSGYKLRPGESYGPDGSVWYTGPRGGRTKIAGPQSSGGDDLTGSGTGQMKMRLGLALGPSITAQNTMEQAERNALLSRDKDWRAGIPGVNQLLTATPLQNDYGASALDSFSAGWGKGDQKPRGPAHAIAKGIGGDDYRNYTQASDTFVTSLLPVFSGNQVTDSEAIRFARANVPEYSDGPEQLKRKAQNRKMLLNYAAQATGAPPPYPDVPSWGLKSAQTVNAQQVAPPRTRNAAPSAPPLKPVAPGSPPKKRPSLNDIFGQ